MQKTKVKILMTMSLKNYEREEMRVLHDLGSFSKGDINVGFFKDIHSTEQGTKKQSV
jgi:hypothetical protein